MFAVSSGSLGIDLQDIPNQPVTFLVSCTGSLPQVIDRCPR